MRCAITGAGGYVARALVAELERDHELTLLSRLRPDSAHSWVAGSVLSEDDCLRAFEGAEAVVHVAAVPDPAPDTFTVNTSGTYNALEAARKQGVRRVVFASSNCVYGQCHRLNGEAFVPMTLPIDESHPCRPQGSYALSKLLDEQMMSTYQEAYGIEVASLRLSWVIGPTAAGGFGGRDVPVDILRLNLEQHAAYLWAYVDVRDAVRGFRLALEAPRLPREHAFNISARDTLAAKDSIDLIATYRPDLADRAASMNGRSSFFAWEKARKWLGYEPQFTWRGAAR